VWYQLIAEIGENGNFAILIDGLRHFAIVQMRFAVLPS
jgi:hypothetical protein